jgi:hypothetical protein
MLTAIGNMLELAATRILKNLLKIAVNWLDVTPALKVSQCP